VQIACRPATGYPKFQVWENLNSKSLNRLLPLLVLLVPAPRRREGGDRGEARLGPEEGVDLGDEEDDEALPAADPPHPVRPRPPGAAGVSGGRFGRACRVVISNVGELQVGRWL